MPLCVCLIVGACTAGPDFIRPAPPGIPAYADRTPAVTAGTVGRGGESQSFLPGRKLPRGWWYWFNSPDLNGLVERAFAGSPTLAAARARLRSAEATLRARRALRSPEVLGTGDASYGNSRGGGGNNQTGTGQGTGGGGGGGGGNPPVDPNAPTDPTQPVDPTQPGAGGQDGGNAQQGGQGGGAFGGPAYLVYTANVTVSYDFDLAGRNRRLVESGRAQVEAQRQELQAAYLALVGNIVSTALQRATLAEQIRVREELVAAQNRRIDLLRIQVEEGATARASLIAALAEVASLRATVPPLRVQLAQSENALAELVGVAPAGAGVPPIRLDGIRLPRAVPLSLPSALVRERPDILAAEALLAAARADIGVAAADLYPNLSLDASFGLGGIESSVGEVYNLGLGLLAPLFDGGRRRARRDVAVAAYQEALANYQVRVLAAFRQVADGIRALEGDAVALAEQRLALDAARESFDLAVFQEREGAVSTIDVLVVQRTFQDASFAYIDALSRRFQDTAALFAAVGPGPLSEEAVASVTLGDPLGATRRSLGAGVAPSAVPGR